MKKIKDRLKNKNTPLSFNEKNKQIKENKTIPPEV
jgi:hypothetical protein